MTNDNDPHDTDRRRISARGIRSLIRLGAIAAAGAGGLLFADQTSTPLHPSFVAAFACLVVLLARPWIASHPRAALSIGLAALATTTLAWVDTSRIAHPDLLIASALGVDLGVFAICSRHFRVTPHKNEPRSPKA